MPRRILRTLARVLPALALGCALLPAIAAGLPAPAAAQQATDALERARIEEVVRQYLLENPEIIVEAMEVLQQRRELARAEDQQRALEAHRDALFAAEGDPVGGNPDGDVTVVEFFDYQCGYCKAVHPSVRELVRSDAGVRIVYKEFPILGPASLTAAKAALAAQRQGRYEDMHDALMELRGPLDEAKVMRTADAIGLDVARLRTDMESDEVRSTIERNIGLARALDVSGTPAFVVGDELVPGAVPLETLQDLVEQARAG